MFMNRWLLLLCLMTCTSTYAAGVRDHTRLGGATGAAITQLQAEELTLTLSETAFRPVQTWVRAAATIETGEGNTLVAELPQSAGALIRTGQRVRAFPLESRASMFQAKIASVDARPGAPRGEAGSRPGRSAGPGLGQARRDVTTLIDSTTVATANKASAQNSKGTPSTLTAASEQLARTSNHSGQRVSSPK